jgi:type I restriction enzyme S subunit
LPEDHRFVSENDYLKITQGGKPEKNDILLTRVGAGIGEAAIIDQDLEFAYYVSLTLIKPFHQYVDSKFRYRQLNREYSKLSTIILEHSALLDFRQQLPNT